MTRLSVNGGFVEARYNLKVEPMPGSDFSERYAKRRKNIILLEDLVPGKIYDEVDVAVFSRRSFYMKEDRFPDVEYAQGRTRLRKPFRPLALSLRCRSNSRFALTANRPLK